MPPTVLKCLSDPVAVQPLNSKPELKQIFATVTSQLPLKEKIGNSEIERKPEGGLQKRPSFKVYYYGRVRDQDLHGALTRA